MIETVLQLISVLDVEIQLLQNRKILEIKPWQDLEEKLITKLEGKTSNNKIPKEIFLIFHKKLKKKNYIIKRYLTISNKLLDVLSNNIGFYDEQGRLTTNHVISILNKRI